jgi:hypothetical protein
MWLRKNLPPHRPISWPRLRLGRFYAVRLDVAVEQRNGRWVALGLQLADRALPVPRAQTRLA